MVTNGSSVETSIKVVLFSGMKKDWAAWEEKFLARSSSKGYKSLLMGDEEVPKSTEDEDKLTDEQKQEKKWNEKAYADLVLSMDTDKPSGRVAFNIIRGTKTAEYADGNAALAWKRLKRKYEPNTAPTLMKLTQLYQNARLKKGRDPDVFVTYLEDLRSRLQVMNWEVTDTQFMVKILNSLPDDYENQMNVLERRIGSNGEDSLTIEDIREELNLRFERINDREKRSLKDEVIENGGEMALFAGGQFKGRCHNCGKYGHKASELSGQD